MMTQQKTFSRLIGWSENKNELLMVSAEGSEAVGLMGTVILFKLDIETGKMIVYCTDCFQAVSGVFADKQNAPALQIFVAEIVI